MRDTCATSGALRFVKWFPFHTRKKRERHEERKKKRKSPR